MRKSEKLRSSDPKGGKPRSVSKKGWGKSPKGESANPKRKGKGK